MLVDGEERGASREADERGNRTVASRRRDAPASTSGGEMGHRSVIRIRSFLAISANLHLPSAACQGRAVISGSIDLLLREDENGNILEARVIDFKPLEGGENPEDNDAVDWTELALQVQLYAMGAREVLGENARTGAVHFLKDNQRIDVPVDDAAVEAAVANVEWAVDRVLDGDLPMRPHPAKCAAFGRHRQQQRR